MSKKDKDGLCDKFRRERQRAKISVRHLERDANIWIQNDAVEAGDVREEDSRKEGIDAITGRTGDETLKTWLVTHLFFSLFTSFLFFVFYHLVRFLQSKVN